MKTHQSRESRKFDEIFQAEGPYSHEEGKAFPIFNVELV